MQELRTDVLIVGGGLGGVAAALAAARQGCRVVLTDDNLWLGGQLTTQAVPPDEHPWVEQFGVTASYRALRDGIREYYRRWYPLTGPARRLRYLNPGAGWVSPLCHEPRVAVAVIEGMLAPYRAAGRLSVLTRYRPVSADVDGDRVRAVQLSAVGADGPDVVVSADYILDATEVGDLLPLTDTEYVTGFESREATGEPSAPDREQPENVQSMAWCFAVDHVDGDHTIDKPDSYDYWSQFQLPFWPDRMLSFTSPNPRTLEVMTSTFTPNIDDDPLAVVADQSKNPGSADLWTFRRIAARRLFKSGLYESDVTLVNWPLIDYVGGSIIDVTHDVADKHRQAAKELSRSVLYWLQTEAPRADGGTGHPGLRLRPDMTGSPDGFAQAPYVREGRRIRALTTVVEQDLSLTIRGQHGAMAYPDSVGIGMYRIDLHPSTGGDNYIDVAACPFQIPLGALIPQRVKNVLPAAKNIGTTHITNGCYRLHPVEWNIGEAAGALAAYCLQHRTSPHAVHADTRQLQDYQTDLERHGVELAWPSVRGY